jgi:hypothetical protein
MSNELPAWLVSFSKMYKQNLHGNGRLYTFDTVVNFNVKVHTSSLPTFISNLPENGFELQYVRALEPHEIYD